VNITKEIGVAKHLAKKSPSRTPGLIEEEQEK